MLETQEQFDFLAELDAQAARDREMEELIRRARIEEKLEAWERTSMSDAWAGKMPAGTVILMEHRCSDPKTGKPQPEKTRYFRTVLGYHRAVSGMMPDLISEPDEDWPDVPEWQPDLDGVKKTYPHGGIYEDFWVRRCGDD